MILYRNLIKLGSLFIVILSFSVSGLAQVGIGTNNPNSTLQVEGSVAAKINVVTDNTTLGMLHSTIICNATKPITISLPSTASIPGRTYTIKNISPYQVTIMAASMQTIDGNNSVYLKKENDKIQVITDGNVWYVVVCESPSNSWQLSGNAGTQSLNFIGTTDNQDIIFKRNNLFSGLLNSGNQNTAFGVSSLAYNSNGYGNTANGFKSLHSNTTGYNNTAVGFSALNLNSTGHHNAAFGDSALYTNTGSYNVSMGSGAMRKNTSGNYNSAAGYNSMLNNTTGHDNSAHGSFSLLNNTTGNFNSAHGGSALYNNTGGNNNTATGYQALYANITGSNNTATGVNALQSNSTGNYNTATGMNVLTLNTSGSYNTACGYYALNANTTGNNNTAYGPGVLNLNTSGTSNTGIGVNALNNNSTGINNTGMGQLALSYNTTGNNNTALGYNAGPVSTANALINSTAIGASSVVDANHRMSFGNTSVNSWMFGRTTISNGVFQVGSNSTNGNGAYLTAGGTWTNASDQNIKSDITPVSGSEVLDKVMKLDITRWKYTGTDEYHIGPMAQQFYGLFNTGINNTSISTIDPAGVALKAIQEQQKLIEALQQRITELELIIKQH